MFVGLALLSGRAVAAPTVIPSLDELAGDWNSVASLRSLPAINSPKGAAKCTSNVLAMEYVGFPPVFISGTTATPRHGRRYRDRNSGSCRLKIRWNSFSCHLEE
jgi:hypothetical protein